MTRRRVAAYTAACALVAAVAVLVSPAFGITRVVHALPWWVRTFPSSEYLMTVPIWGGNEASLWLVPGEAGDTCVALRITTQATHQPPLDVPPGLGFANYGLDCSLGGSLQPAGQIQVTLGWGPPTLWRGVPKPGAAVVLMSGHVPDGMGITNVELRSGSGGRPLPLKKGYFFAWLQGSTNMDELPNGGPYFVVASDAAGKEVASFDLQKFVEQAIPK